jgi:hypothetical protein
VLCDGGLHSLLACAMAREECTVAGLGPGDPALPGWEGPLAAPFPASITGPQADAVLRHAQRYSMRLADSSCLQSLLAAYQHPIETLTGQLLGAAYLGARLGCAKVVWPISAGAGEDLDLDVMAHAANTALLVSRLAALNADHHGVPGIQVVTPLLDLNDAQAIELAYDMSVPVETCWWWGSGQAEEDRWRAAFERLRATPGV